MVRVQGQFTACSSTYSYILEKLRAISEYLRFSVEQPVSVDGKYFVVSFDVMLHYTDLSKLQIVLEDLINEKKVFGL